MQHNVLCVMLLLAFDLGSSPRDTCVCAVDTRACTVQRSENLNLNNTVRSK